MSTIEKTTRLSNRYVWSQYRRGNTSFDTGPHHERSFVNLGTGFRTTGTEIGPNWKLVIAHGGNATTDMVASGKEVISQELTSFTCGFRTWDGDELVNEQWTELAGNYIIAPVPNTADEAASAALARADNLALIRYYQRIAAVHSVFKGMVFGGELAESLRMIKSPAKKLRMGINDYLDYIKRYGRSRHFSRRDRFVRDTWLEYSFGWKPLISDIDNAVDAFYNSRLVKPLFRFIKANSGIQEESRTITARSIISSWDGHTRRWNDVLVPGAGVRYYGVYHSRGNGVLNSHAYGFKPQEFIPTLWELIPYSFLVDYFTNLGDIVSSWSYRSLGPAWTSKGTIRQILSYTERGRVERNTSLQANYLTYSSGGLGMSTLRSKFVRRTRLVILGIPSFEFECPGLTSTKWLNLAALSTKLAATRRALRS